MDKKRLIYMAIFIVVCILLGYAIYRVFFARKALLEIGTITPGESGEFPISGEGKIPGQLVIPPSQLPSPGTVPITTSPTQPGAGQPVLVIPPGTLSKALITQTTQASTLGAAPAKNSGARFYNMQDGKFYRIKPDGTIELLRDQIFYNVQNVTWSPKNNESIIEYPDGANIYYNFDTGEQVSLPKHWEDFSFSAEGSQIASKSIGLDPGNRWLITSDPKGTQVKLIEPMGENASKVTVDWSPNRQVVALSATGDPLNGSRQQILLVGLNHENFKSITVEGYGLESQWSKSGEKLLHSVYSPTSNYKPELWIVGATPDNAGQNRKPLGVNTWASKCTMSDDRFAYCGVPNTLDDGSGFAPQIADGTPDELYKIDTVTGIKTKIQLDDIYTIASMFTSTDGKTLYFTDKNKNGIFEMPI
ncbi:MAG: hypothetical protein HYV41_04050 [Candidatus Magasanikbacteria bacterium]|nr:hypothetical protein [Candidatus Magasanikbacteria bacterium]